MTSKWRVILKLYILLIQYQWINKVSSMLLHKWNQSLISILWKKLFPLVPLFNTFYHIYLVFRVSKDLYLVITQKLMLENCQFSHEKWQFSCEKYQFLWKLPVFTWKPYKSTNSTQILQFDGVLGGGYVSGFHENCHFSWKLLLFMKTAAFHENRMKDHQLPGMVTPMFHCLS